MFKTISAALIAASLIAAPAMAAGTTKSVKAPVTKSVSIKSNVLNPNAKMGRQHSKHFRHHRLHKMSAIKTHHASKVVVKRVGVAAKRG